MHGTVVKNIIYIYIYIKENLKKTVNDVRSTSFFEENKKNTVAALKLLLKELDFKVTCAQLIL